MNPEKVLSAHPDFKHKPSVFQNLVGSCGQVLLLSPKYYSGIARERIENSRGMSKMKFRWEINDEMPAHLHRNMIASMCQQRS